MWENVLGDVHSWRERGISFYFFVSVVCFYVRIDGGLDQSELCLVCLMAFVYFLGKLNLEMHNLSGVARIGPPRWRRNDLGAGPLRYSTISHPMSIIIAYLE